jgi:hypothetical protein
MQRRAMLHSLVQPIMVNDKAKSSAMQQSACRVLRSKRAAHGLPTPDDVSAQWTGHHDEGTQHLPCECGVVIGHCKGRAERHRFRSQGPN